MAFDVTAPTVARVRIRVTGVVQGVGFRPFVYGVATSLGMAGHVGNDADGVFIEAEGPRAAIEEFERRLRADAPPRSLVDRVATEVLEPSGAVGFSIVESDPGGGSDVTPVPPDTAVCEACLAELHDPSDRRYRYPFIACTHCGPRFSIVTGLPYDRPSTTMARFDLCPACRREYEDPTDRRFHAQPTACPACGPQLAFRAAGETGPSAFRDDALAAALRVLADGGIVAVKGVGGYHLAVDATRTDAVERLRKRKRRSAKPFAVMVRDAGVAASLAHLTPEATSLLASPQAPVVLAPARSDEPGPARLARAVAPGNGLLGVLVPYAPLHHLLFTPHPAVPEASFTVLVMTSANLAEEPICTDPVEADARLDGIADAWLHHDRPIHVACDDSVVRTAEGAMLPVRRSRGYAPLPVALPLRSLPALAVGGELKTTACLAAGHRAVMSQHVGDTGNLETLALLDRTVDVLMSLTRIRPELVVADAHPAYLSQRWAADRAGSLGAPLVLVQHHHAHLGSLLAEHGVAPGEEVLGFVFDGTGFGSDGTIWGGEVLLGSYGAVERVGHLVPVALPGGDAAIRRPARSALAHLRAAGIEWDPLLPPVAVAGATERQVVARMLDTGTSCTPTTSMGRLFDAVASLLGVCQDGDYEGQAAIELEALAATVPPRPGAGPDWRLDVRSAGGGLLIDPAPALAAGVASVRSGAPAALAARFFHEALADAVAEVACRVRVEHGVTTVGLTGGVFQNALLSGGCRGRLAAEGFTVLTHRVVPPNDGGLALGQIAIAAGSGVGS